jgi:hypothetical protein
LIPLIRLAMLNKLLTKLWLVPICPWAMPRLFPLVALLMPLVPPLLAPQTLVLLLVRANLLWTLL